jgi:signal transduction histidine kinase
MTVISAYLLSRFLSRNMLMRDAVVTMAFVQSIVQAKNTVAYFEEEDRGNSKAAFEDFFEQIAVMPEVERVNVYGKDGTVLWSKNERVIGHRFMPNPELIRALSGELAVTSGTSGKPAKAEHVFDKEVPYYAEIYIPIWNNRKERIVGAVEVYKVPLTLLQAIKNGNRLIWVSSLLGGLFLYGSLFGIVRRADSVIQQQQEERIQSEKLAGIGIMAAGIAHEVNNPLAVMLGKAEMILEEEDPTRIKKYAHDIIKFAKKASEIVKGITFYSRAASAPGTGGQIHLNDQLKEGIKLSQYANPFDHVELITDFQSIPPVRGHAGEIQQVFVNLINNAVQAMEGKGRLFVTSRYEDGFVVVTVRDTGAGIKKEHLNQLFTPFFTTKDPGEGTGLGLGIVHKIIADHGGSISVESEEGQGATFIVRLPCVYESSKGKEKKDNIKVKKTI